MFASPLPPEQLDPGATLRERMVREQLVARAIEDPEVLRAMRTVPRHEFVESHNQRLAYTDSPLPIGYGQTISQPYIVALTVRAADVRRGSRVLDVGTGSGYQAAVLAELGAEVWSIERILPLAAEARRALKRTGYESVHVIVGDGAQGYAPAAPYDAIVVAAAARKLPAHLVDQLRDGGRLVIPLGPEGEQQLMRFTRMGQDIRVDSLGPCAFVPFVGTG